MNLVELPQFSKILVFGLQQGERGGEEFTWMDGMGGGKFEGRSLKFEMGEMWDAMVLSGGQMEGWIGDCRLVIFEGEEGGGV